MTDTHQFEQFLANYQNMVFSTAIRLVANETEAQDIAQEVFMKAYEHFDDLKNSPTAGGWLKTVTTNLSLNHLSRYRSRWSFFSELQTAHDEDESRELEFADEKDFSEAMAASDRHALVDRALRGLPAAQRVPLVLFHLEGLSYEEIATKLRVSLGKVKTDIFRGREALRRKLQIQLQDDLEIAGREV